MNSILSVWFVLMLSGVLSLDNSEQTDDLFKVHHKMTSNELQRYFGVSSLPDVPEYDVSYPIDADKYGQEISKNRAKRDADISGRKYYHLRAFGEKLHLNVTLNKDLLGPNFYVETRHKDGTTTISDAPHRKFYHGHVVSQPDAFVAISENRGVSGAIRIRDDEMLYFEPLPDHLINEARVEKSLPHLITKRSASSFKRNQYQMFEREENPRREEPPLTENSETSSENYDENKHMFYEVLYAGDHLIVEQVGLRELPEMLLIVGNIVSRIYTDTTFGDVKLTYVVTKLLIFNNGELNYLRNASNGNKLDALARWMRDNNPADDDNPEHVDAGTLFTSYTGGGLALVGGICAWRDMTSVVGSIGLSSSDIAAHENFHNLGGSHDGGPGCPNGRHIMSTYVPSGAGSFTWSNCSKRFIQKFMRSERSSCLRDVPQHKRPLLPPIIRDMLPGEVFDGDKQCEYKRVLGAKQCHVSCGHLFCRNPNGGCYSTGGAPAAGTKCGDGKWCIRGECVSSGAPPVDGGWSSWSDYSECTRTCGVGVRHRKKLCNNPSPMNSGKPCLEPHKSYEYETCNIQDCPAGSTSFRLMQCTAKSNNSRPYIRSGSECYLWCHKGGWATLHGQVIDGTRCYGDHRRDDICTRGECKALGCGKDLTEAVHDRCGVCAGDGATCLLQVIHYTKDYNIVGYDKADTIIVLKPGYMNVHAKMKGISKNTIGVQNERGTFLIKLPTNTKTINHQGMEITYINENDNVEDEILIKGKVTTELKLVFVYKEGKNEGVEVRFYTPVTNPQKPSQDTFYWKGDEWSACSSSIKCGEGVSFRDVRCFRKDDHSRVGDGFCFNYEKPVSEKQCHMKQCEAEWYSYVTPCSKTCGRGIEQNIQICRRMQNEHSWIKVDESECTGERPDFTPHKRYCNQMACRPEYATGPWSQCSTTCNEGVVTRTLKCQVINNEGGITELPMQTCEHYNLAKPLATERCNFDKPCQKKPLYAGVGCFKDRKRNRTMTILGNFRGSIDWKDMPKSFTEIIEKCASLAEERKLEYFAIQFYGECWGTPRDHHISYDKHGPSNDCFMFTSGKKKLGVGKSLKNYVYRMVNNTTAVV